VSDVKVGDKVIIHRWQGEPGNPWVAEGTVEFIEPGQDFPWALVLGLVEDQNNLFAVTDVVEVNGEKVGQ
jgi:hypothetical protein